MAFRIPISQRAKFTPRKDRTDLATTYLLEVISGKTAVQENGCWVWTGWKNQDGYGYFKIEGKIYRVHRLIFECCKGDVPAGKLALHDCPGGDNPSCCNPSHLWLGTEKSNILDCVKKRRHPASILTDDQVREIISDTSSSDPVKRTYNHYKYLARKYKVSPETIKGIVYGKNWGHIRDGHGSGVVESAD